MAMVIGQAVFQPQAAFVKYLSWCREIEIDPLLRHVRREFLDNRSVSLCGSIFSSFGLELTLGA
jgi:hypothetical protein